MNGPSFLAELKRRKVVRVALVYGATAFAMLEAADLIVPRLALPDWTITLLLVLVMLGFPIALALAWAFDLTPEGVRPEVPTEEAATAHAAPGVASGGRGTWVGGRTLLATGVMLALGLALGAGWFAGSSMAGSGAPSDGHRVAVLPLRDMDPDGSSAILAAGVQEDLLTRLSKIGELSIISRTSVEEYAGTSKSIPEIASELGATAIIEGGVQRAGDHVRINVQLIDGRSDEHLWAETFDRPWSMDNLFAIQSEIAERVAEALRAALSPDERARIDDRPTESEAAYELYVQARNAYQRGGAGGPQDLREAVRFAEGAIAADSSFAEAYAVLSLAHAFLFWIQADRTPARLESARAAADRAAELDPSLAEAYVAKGMYHYWGFLDYDAALAEFRRAERLNPDAFDLYQGFGSVHRRQGRMNEAIAYFRRSLENNPRTASVASTVGESLGLAGRFAEADSLHALAIRLDPTAPFYPLFRAVTVVAMGDTARARIHIEAAARLADKPEEQVRGWHQHILRLARDPLAELQVAEQAQDSIGFSDQYYLLPSALMRAEALRRLGREQEARSAYSAAVALLETWVENRPDDERAWSSLGLAYSGLGREREAVRAARRGTELLSVDREAWRGAVRADDLARVYVRFGRREAALDILEDLMDRPARTVVSPALLRLDREWDPIRADARFRALLAAPAEWSP
ncbi:MAG TPA: tetratricopeptide repeat protein [Longimicrobiales bacterium]|nr:tetratricopeptide repeat protein [Longimicrobiales bacterium]